MIELVKNIDRYTVETSYKRAKEAQLKNSYGSDRWSSLAFNHAKNRDPKILLALEQAANVMNQIWEEQLGNYARQHDIAENHKSKPIEVQMWTEAYRLADEGNAIRHFKWIYYAAYELAYGEIR